MDRQNETDSKKSKEFGPEEQTLHTTDPQKNMKGPMSSPTRETGEAFDSGETREDADEKRDKRI